MTAFPFVLIVSHNALIHALNDYSAFGVLLFLLLVFFRVYDVKYKLVLRLGYNKLCVSYLYWWGRGLVNLANDRHYCQKGDMALRALARILKTGVQDSHLAKSRSPTGKSGSPTQKRLESHQFLHTVYLFHFSRKWYIWIIFRLTDFNPLSMNGLFLLNKTIYFAIFFHVTSTHIFLFGLIKIKD